MRKAVARMMPNKLKILDDNPDSSATTTTTTTSRLVFPLTSTKTSSNSLTSSFKIDFNSVSEFYVTLDNPHNSWLPGDEVSGQIILISKKNLANITITLSLIGYVKINASSHSKLRPVKHNLFNHTIKIYGSDDNNTSDREFFNGLFKGEHRFPFIVKLPNKRIYTSIDFGKGSITYMLIASMHDSDTLNSSISSPGSSPSSNTSPSSPGILSKTKNLKIMNKTNYTSEKLINLINPIDVSELPIPKPKKLIIKDPRFNKKLSRTISSNSNITTHTYSTFSSNNSDQQVLGATETNGNTPLETSQLINLNYDHHSPTSIGNYQGETTAQQVAETSSTSAQTPSSVSYDFESTPDTIKVCLIIPRKGYLKGELIPIKIKIDHLRKVQDLNGIIVTFVRVCRLDNGPNGVYHSFRKDLVQSIVPLYVDPNTFQSEITTSIRVPADAFPTISDCPLVTFQYFIEVLINLSGKSIALDAINNSPGNENNHGSPLIDFPSSSNIQEESINSTNQMHSIRSVNDVRFQYKYIASSTDINQKERATFVNTDKYKRLKKFLQLTSEIIVGTHRLSSDEERTGISSGTPDDMQVLNSPLSRRSSTSDPPTTGHSPLANVQNYPNISPPNFNGSSLINPYGNNNNNNNSHTGIQLIPEIIETHPDQNVPDYSTVAGGMDLLPMPEHVHSNEKERIRAHESSLLPSEPPLEFDDESRAVSPIGEDILREQSGVSGGLDDDFFEASNNSTINEQYGYVPAYEGSSNDMLVQGYNQPQDQHQDQNQEQHQEQHQDQHQGQHESLDQSQNQQQ